METNHPPTDAEKINFFANLGHSTLPDKYRQQVLTVFQKYPEKWYTPELFAEGLQMSPSYAYKICEALKIARIVEGTKCGKQNYYRLKEHKI